MPFTQMSGRAQVNSALAAYSGGRVGRVHAHGRAEPDEQFKRWLGFCRRLEHGPAPLALSSTCTATTVVLSQSQRTTRWFLLSISAATTHCRTQVRQAGTCERALMVVRTWYVSVASRDAGPGILQRTSNAVRTPNILHLLCGAFPILLGCVLRILANVPRWTYPIHGCGFGWSIPTRSPVVCLRSIYDGYLLCFASRRRMSRCQLSLSLCPPGFVSVDTTSAVKHTPGPPRAASIKSGYLSRSSRMHCLETGVTVHSAPLLLLIEVKDYSSYTPFYRARDASPPTQQEPTEATRVADHAHARTTCPSSAPRCPPVAAHHHWRRAWESVLGVFAESEPPNRTCLCCVCVFVYRCL